MDNIIINNKITNLMLFDLIDVIVKNLLHLLNHVVTYVMLQHNLHDIMLMKT